MNYEVKLEVFRGPLELLFHLIEKNEVDIYDIPIAEITKQYLAYLETMERFDLEITSEFVVMAATLISIKAKMLLPKSSKVTVENPDIEDDPRNELVEKLLEYKKFKLLAEYLQQREEDRNKIFFRPNDEEIYLSLFSDTNPLEGISLVDLTKALQDILAKVKPNELTTEIIREEITIQEKMIQITDFLSAHPHGITFGSLFNKTTQKIEIIVQFLALLELVRLEFVKVRQQACNSDIIIFPGEKLLI